MQVPTRASKLGMTSHLSLLKGFVRAHEPETVEDILDEAVALGCYHFLRTACPPVSKVSNAH